MQKNFVYVSSRYCGYQNLATDEWLLDHVGEEDLILHLYQNENAVIIGKNQNPWLECNLAKMQEEGVQLVRRVSGGGAVYHDLGNLNFSFIAGPARYDLDRQLNLILTALKKLGVDCSFSGRNDLVWQEKKFSGTAYATRHGKKQHHGTLLISSDLSRLSRYLTVDPKKIRSKGISSVRARVCNLNESLPDLQVSTLRNALIQEFETEYGAAETYVFTDREREEIAAYETKHRSDSWRLGETPKFDLEWRERFSWGGVQILFSFEKGIISDVKVFSDSMNTDLAGEIESRLSKIAFENNAIRQALLSSDLPQVREIASFSFL